MRMLPVSIPLLALVVCAGCASDQSGTSTMGAGSTASASNERTLYCKDGAYMPKSIGCPAGVERELTPSAATQR